jgi:hypothetical protein
MGVHVVAGAAPRKKINGHRGNRWKQLSGCGDYHTAILASF